MSLLLKQIAAPDVPVEADTITPARLAGLGTAEVEKLTLITRQRAARPG